MAYDEDLADSIRELLGGDRHVTEKRMFGGLAFLIDGKMSVTASRSGGLLARVDPAQTDRLLRNAHVEPFEMRGRPMDGWLRVAVADLPDDAIDDCIARGVAYARSLPSK